MQSLKFQSNSENWLEFDFKAGHIKLQDNILMYILHNKRLSYFSCCYNRLSLMDTNTLAQLCKDQLIIPICRRAAWIQGCNPALGQGRTQGSTGMSVKHMYIYPRAISLSPSLWLPSPALSVRKCQRRGRKPHQGPLADTSKIPVNCLENSFLRKNLWKLNKILGLGFSFAIFKILYSICQKFRQINADMNTFIYIIIYMH